MTRAFHRRADAEAEAARLRADGCDVTLIASDDGLWLVTARLPDPAGPLIVFGGFLVAATSFALWHTLEGGM